MVSCYRVFHSIRFLCMFLLRLSCKFGHLQNMVGGGLELFFKFSRENWGKMDPIWRSYFSKGLVQPPTRNSVLFFQIPTTGLWGQNGWLVKIWSGQTPGVFSGIYIFRSCWTWAAIQKQITAVFWFQFLSSDFMSCVLAVFHWPPSHRFALTNNVSGPVYETHAAWECCNA